MISEKNFIIVKRIIIMLIRNDWGLSQSRCVTIVVSICKNIYVYETQWNLLNTRTNIFWRRQEEWHGWINQMESSDDRRILEMREQRLSQRIEPKSRCSTYNINVFPISQGSINQSQKVKNVSSSRRNISTFLTKNQVEQIRTQRKVQVLWYVR